MSSQPGTDVSVAGWSFTGASSVAASIGEAVRNDSSYTTSPDTTVAGPAITTLNTSLTPGTYTLNFVGLGTQGYGAFKATLLDASNNPVGTTAWQNITGSLTSYSLTLTIVGGTATQIKMEVMDGVPTTLLSLGTDALMLGSLPLSLL